MLIKAIAFIIFILILLASFYYGQCISMEEQLPLFEALRNTASIIFAVMGAWLAILHPTSLKQVFSEHKNKITDEDTKTINLLLSPIIISTFILMFVLIIPILVVVGKKIVFLGTYISFIRGISFSILVLLTVLQVWTLILTLVPNDILKRTIQKKQAKQKVRKRQFSETRKKNKKI